jgi:hypothetical protein
MTTRASWSPVTNNRPCPLCGGTSWCSRSTGADGEQIIRCARTDVAPPGWRLIAEKPDHGNIYGEGEAKPPPGVKRKKSWAERHEECVAAISRDRDLLIELSESLDLSIEALVQLDVGWSKRDKAWTFPERDAAGNITGLNRRYRNGDKAVMKGGNRGIYFPRDFLERADPVLVVEGPTDTAALLMIGITAVGRPNDRGGVQHLVRKLAGRERQTFVMGENDPNHEQMRWPGLEGARSVAASLGHHWRERVRYVLPPDGAKDIRAWISQRAADGDDDGTIRHKLLAHIDEKAKWSDERWAGDADPHVRDLITNVQTIVQDQKQVTITNPLPSIIETLHSITDGWPRRLQGLPFIADLETPPQGILPSNDAWFLLTKADDLFGWIHGFADVYWADARAKTIDPISGEPRTPVGRGEFYSALRSDRRRDANYESIELLPHFPPMEKAFYLPCSLPKSGDGALEEFMDRLNPETEEDRSLLLAMLMTMGWGGPPGRRPAFVITTLHGTGAGKTRTAQLISDVWGGCIMVAEHEEWEQVRSRLLDDEALKKRVVLIDNIRGKMSRSGLESAITASVLDGKRMYVGHFARPNTLTWVMTANTPALSQDLTTRAMVIRIGPKKDSSTFESWAEEFMKHRRSELIADVMNYLSGPRLCRIPNDEHDRWGPWIQGVLERLPNGREVLGYARENRDSVNQDLEDAIGVRNVIARLCRMVNIDIDQHTVRIPGKLLYQSLVDEEVVVRQKSQKATSMWIDSLRGLEPLKPISRTKYDDMRGWLWKPKDAVNETPFMLDPDEIERRRYWQSQRAPGPDPGPRPEEGYFNQYGSDLE